MIPILYKATEKEFRTNGIGRLSDAQSCTVREQRNGDYSLSLSYPSDGAYAQYLVPGNIIYATHDTTKDAQPFDIVDVRVNDTTIDVQAEHVSCRIRNVLCVVTTGIFGGPDSAMSALNDSLDDPDDKTYANDVGIRFASDIDAAYIGEQLGIPASETIDLIIWFAEADNFYDVMFGDKSGGFYKMSSHDNSYRGYGDVGDFLRDKWGISYLKNRGKKTGTILRVGTTAFAIRNGYEMTDREMIMGVMPVWRGTDPYTGNPTSANLQDAGASSPIVWADNIQDYAYKKVVPYDLSAVFSERPTKKQMLDAAREYMYNNRHNTQTAYTYSVNTAALQDSKVGIDAALCDYVQVYSGEGRKEWLKVIETVWDVLGNRYTSMTVGKPLPTLSKLIKEQTKATTTLTDTSKQQIKALERKSVPDIYTYPTGYDPDDPAGWVPSGGGGGIGQQYTDSQGRKVEQIATVGNKPIFAPVGGGGGGGWTGTSINLYRVERTSLPIPGAIPGDPYVVTSFGQVISGSGVTPAQFKLIGLYLQACQFTAPVSKTGTTYKMDKTGQMMTLIVQMRVTLSGQSSPEKSDYYGVISVPCDVSADASGTSGNMRARLSLSGHLPACIMQAENADLMHPQQNPKIGIAQLNGVAGVLQNATNIKITKIGGFL